MKLATNISRAITRAVSRNIAKKANKIVKFELFCGEIR